MDISTRFNQFRDKYGIPGSVLKIIAIITMFIDHAAPTVITALKQYPSVMSHPVLGQIIPQMYGPMRRIGRLAFPIFCFLLVEGYLHTSNVRKYAVRLAIFALISEFPFDYALHHGQKLMSKQNVYFTLLIGLLVLWGIDQAYKGKIAIQLMIMVLGMIVAQRFHTDYRYHGVFLIETLYILKFSRLFQCLGGGAYMQYEKFPTPLAFLPVLFYNGKRGRQMKYFYYWFYPVHLMLLGLTAYIILPAVLG